MSYSSARPVQQLGYDVVTKKWAPQPRLQVGPDGTLDIEIVEQLPTEGNNPSLVLGYTGDNLTTITKTIDGVSYRKILAYTGAVLDSVSAWVQI